MSGLVPLPKLRRDECGQVVPEYEACLSREEQLAWVVASVALATGEIIQLFSNEALLTRSIRYAIEYRGELFGGLTSESAHLFVRMIQLLELSGRGDWH